MAILLLGRVLVICLTIEFTWLYYENTQTNIKYKLVPLVMSAIGSYLIATLFFSVMSTAIDTVFLCYLEDRERNNGSPEKPYYMSKTLKKLLNK